MKLFKINEDAYVTDTGITIQCKPEFGDASDVKLTGNAVKGYFLYINNVIYHSRPSVTPLFSSTEKALEVAKELFKIED